MDGLANDSVPPEGLRVCNDVDYSKPPLGGVTIRPPIANRPLTKDMVVKRKQDPIYMAIPIISFRELRSAIAIMGKPSKLEIARAYKQSTKK